MTKMDAIKTFFKADGGREVTTAELAVLARSKDENGVSELSKIAALCAEALGQKLDVE